MSPHNKLTKVDPKHVLRELREITTELQKFYPKVRKQV